MLDASAVPCTLPLPSFAGSANCALHAPPRVHAVWLKLMVSLPPPVVSLRIVPDQSPAIAGGLEHGELLPPPHAAAARAQNTVASQTACLCRPMPSTEQPIPFIGRATRANGCVFSNRACGSLTLT